MAATHEMKLGNVARDLTLQVTVTGQRRFAIRAWLGAQLIRLAAVVMGCQVEVTLAGEPKAPAPRPSLDVPPVHLSITEIMDGIANITMAEAQRILVSLDGVEVKEVVAYDCEAGWVERHKRGPDGQVLLKGDQVEMERLTGRVTAEFREAA